MKKRLITYKEDNILKNNKTNYKIIKKFYQS